MELQADQLYYACDLSAFDFETTADLKTDEVVGQPRAIESIRLAVGMTRRGYNIFAVGQPGTGRRFLVEHFLKESAARKPASPDLCYVNNFAEPRKPRLLQLTAGVAAELQRDVNALIEEIRSVVPAALASEEYQARIQALRKEIKDQAQQLIADLERQAKEKGLAVVQTPTGAVFTPLRGDRPMSTEEFEALSEAEREHVNAVVAELEQSFQKIIQQVPRRERELTEKVRNLEREIIGLSVGHLFDDLASKHSNLKQVVDYLREIQQDVTENAKALLQAEHEQPGIVSGTAIESPLTRRYGVNVLVNNAGMDKAPVIFEEFPTYENLIGRIEHIAQMGILSTDFTLIRAGALHRANGGYLVLEAAKLLTQPFAWEGLKRALLTGRIHIESLAHRIGLISTVTLEPEPLALDIKIVVLGDPFLYHLLLQFDPDFPELFKIAADFEEDFERDGERQRQYASLIASLISREGLQPFDRGAVARVIEHSARTVGDADRLSFQISMLTDLLQEAHHWAQEASRNVTTSADVQKAIDAHIYRSDRIRERLQYEIRKNRLYIDTSGSQAGQINGLAAIPVAGLIFGQPVRITARVRLGKGELVNIEREVELSGPMHSKGVLILAGFLGGRYASDHPLSLTASLVFEQSYSGVEGDSASLAELCSLLSAIAEIPIDQSLAVTGSVNQHGQVQPVGGVNEKIEAFFDTCKLRGVAGNQGVIIPASNIRNLMLREDVRKAVAAGEFHIHAVETVDQAMELLTHIDAGERLDSGEYPPDTVNHYISSRLRDLAQKRMEHERLRMQARQGAAIKKRKRVPKIEHAA